MSRLHVHIAVADLDQNIRFYSAMFGTEPSVVKDDYAKWDLDNPAVNFPISARSTKIGLDHVGIEAHGKNPHAIAVMGEVSIDISGQESTRVDDAMLQAADLVVTGCGHADEHCPILPPGTRKEHWPLDGPARASGSEDEIMPVFRASRDEIKQRVTGLLQRIEQEGSA